MVGEHARKSFLEPFASRASVSGDEEVERGSEPA